METTTRVSRFARQDVILAAGCATVSLAVYLLTLAPELPSSSWGMDSGDLISATYLGRLSHPPGAPLYWLLTRLFVHIAFGNPAWCMNVFSAFSAATTVGIITLTLLYQGTNPWISITSGFGIAFSPLFWSHAIITEVYALVAMWVALFMLLQAIGHRQRHEYAIWTGLVTGLAASVHLTALVLCIPGLPKTNRNRVLYVMGVLLGLSTYFVLLFVRPCMQLWGDVCSFTGWWEFVSARLYTGYSFALPWAQIPSRVLALLSTFSRMFTPLGAIAIMIGVGQILLDKNTASVARITPHSPLTYGLALLCVSVYAMFYNTGDSIVYLVPMLPILGYILAISLERIAAWKVPPPAYLLIPVLLLAFNWSQVSLAKDYAIARHQEQVLAQLPEHALVLTQQGNYTFDLWYSVDVIGERRDVLIIDESLWQYAPYRAYLRANYLDVPGTEDPRSTGRTLCVISSNEVLCD